VPSGNGLALVEAVGAVAEEGEEAEKRKIRTLKRSCEETS